MKKETVPKEPNILIQDKIIINSISDLLKIPINKINNSKIEDFSGIYFNKIYEEAIESESKKEDNKHSTPDKIQILNKNLKQNEKIVIAPKLKIINKNVQIKKENSNIKHYYDEDFEIPKNKHRKEYNDINEKNLKGKTNIKYDDTKDNNSENDNNKLSISNPKGDIKKRKNSEIPINKIIFSINYNSFFGEEVAILGSLSKLGSWELNGALKLKWSEGNVWIGEINIEDDDWENIEFKFIVIEKGKIKRWEQGENNLINFDELIKNILSNKVGRYNKYKYEYNKNEETLSIKCHWH